MATKQEKWRREEAERRRLQNIKESREQLSAILAAWGAARQVEAFFEDCERRAESLSAEDRKILLDRVRQARALFGGVNANERLLSWKAPEDSNSGNWWPHRGLCGPVESSQHGRRSFRELNAANATRKGKRIWLI